MPSRGSRRNLVSVAETPASSVPGSRHGRSSAIAASAGRRRRSSTTFLRCALPIWSTFGPTSTHTSMRSRPPSARTTKPEYGVVLCERELSSSSAGSLASAWSRRAHNSGSGQRGAGDPRSRSSRFRDARRSGCAHPESSRLHLTPQARYLSCGHRRVHRRHGYQGPSRSCSRSRYVPPDTHRAAHQDQSTLEGLSRRLA